MKSFRLLTACAAPALIAALALPAQAQETAAPASAGQQADEAEGSGEIVVTAQGRAQQLADVPIAVSAVSAATLELTGANDIRQLNQVAPSLLVSSTGSEANTSARIRGVGTVGDNPGIESSVATFIDGVYRSRTGNGLNDLGEIERIEVLRGPQGTLGGRNSSAGMINIVTKSPSFHFGGMAEGTYGNYDLWRLQGAVTGPVSDTLALRLDGLYVKRNGFYRDVNSGYDINDRNRYLLRGQALFQPNSDLSIRLIADYSRKDEDCCGAVYATSAIAPANEGLITPTSGIARVLTGITGRTFDQYFPAYNDPYSRRVAITPGRNYAGVTKDYGFSGQVDWNLGSIALTSITAYREFSSYQAADVDYGYADIANYLPGSGRDFKTFTQELRLRGNAFGDHLDWLVGGYFAHEKLRNVSRLQFGNDYGRFAACRVFLSATASGPLAPLAAYFSPTSTGCVSPTGQAVLSGALGAAGPAIVAGFNRLDTVRNVGDDNAVYDQTSDNFAFFTHDIIHVTDKLDVTLGLRYTNETKKLLANFNNTNTICPAQQAALAPYLSSAVATLAGGLINLACQGNSTSTLNAVTLNSKRKEDRLTGTAIVSYKPMRDVMVYASYSRGYKAGGYNLDRSDLDNPTTGLPLPYSAFSPANAAYYGNSLQFDEETVDAYEVGVKYNTRRFSLNIAAFRQEFSNFQLNTFNGTVYIVQNIEGCKVALSAGRCPTSQLKPGLVSQGVEVEASLSPIRDLRANFGVTYADTRYAKRLVGNKRGDPLDPYLSLLPGDNLSNAPEWVATSSLAYTPDIGSSGLSGLFYIDARLSDDYNTGSDLFPQKEQDSYVLMNARVGLRGPNERWAIEFWAQNLLDTQYTQVSFNSPYQAITTTAQPWRPAGTQIFSSYLGEPRTYGVTLRTRF